MSEPYSELNRNSIVCDASSLISLAEGCMLDVLSLLHQYMYGDFIYPRTVRYESIEHPLNMKEHSLRALRLMDYEHGGVLKVVDLDVTRQMKDIMNISNSIFKVKGKPIKLVDPGEAAQVALAIELGISNILIDERTMRTLIEAPFKLKKHLEREFKKDIYVEDRLLDRLLDLSENLKIIRSSELVILAYEKGYFDRYGEHKQDALQSALYTLKFSGCSISFEEIDEIMREVYAGKL